jgi:hypothetical protein
MHGRGPRACSLLSNSVLRRGMRLSAVCTGAAGCRRTKPCRVSDDLLAASCAHGASIAAAIGRRARSVRRRRRRDRAQLRRPDRVLQRAASLQRIGAGARAGMVDAGRCACSRRRRSAASRSSASWCALTSLRVASHLIRGMAGCEAHAAGVGPSPQVRLLCPRTCNEGCLPAGTPSASSPASPVPADGVVVPAAALSSELAATTLPPTIAFLDGPVSAELGDQGLELPAPVRIYVCVCVCVCVCVYLYTYTCMYVYTRTPAHTHTHARTHTHTHTHTHI